jgi:hypothetical protein
MGGDRQREGDQRGAAGALGHPCRDEDLLGARDGGHGGTRPKGEHPGTEDAASAEDVTEAAARDHERGEGEEVGVLDPLKPVR